MPCSSKEWLIIFQTQYGNTIYEKKIEIHSEPIVEDLRNEANRNNLGF